MVDPGDSDPTREPATPRDSSHRIGPYQLLQKIGEGGMGEVWVAEQREPIRRTVAVKVIKIGMDTREVVARFEAERQALAVMDHPAIARVLDAGATEQGRPYFVMEYVKGEPITTYCDRQRLNTADRLALFCRVCEGVQHAHQKGIIHRDLKPSNILVTIQDGQPVPKIIDFGIAKATAQRLTQQTAFTELGVLVGTPEYMSPEQAEMTGLDIDTRTDVYALGVLLYELLTGTLPFDPKMLRQKGLDEIRRVIRETEPPRPSTRITQLGAASTSSAKNRLTEPSRLASQLRGDLDWITMKALEKDRTRRYDTAMGLAGDVQRHLQDEPVTAGPPSTVYRARKFVRRHRFGVGAAVATVLVLVAFAGAMGVEARRTARERDRANREAAAARQVSDFLVGLFQVSDPGEARGNTITAREVLDKASREIEEELKEDPAVKGTLLCTMASVYDGLGLYAQALQLGEKSLAQFRSATAPDPAAVGRALTQNAVIYRHLGQYQKAEPLYREALAVQEKALGPDHADVGRTLDDFGVFQQEMAKYAEAEKLHERALAILERTTGPRSRDTATALTNLANVCNLLGRYDAAEGLQRRALEIQESLLGPDHPEVAFSLNNLATIYFNLDRYDRADEIFRRVLAHVENVQGKDHPDVAIVVNNLANVAQAQGNYRAAEGFFLRAIDIVQRTVGPEHGNVATGESNLANVYRDLGRYGEAESRQRSALAADRKAFGDDHPNVAFDLHRLSVILRETGRAAEAAPQQRHAVDVLTKELGPDHPTLAIALMVLADIEFATGSAGEAEATCRRALAISEKASGQWSGDVTDIRLRLAAVLLETGREAEAGPLLSMALEACSKAAARGDTGPYQLVRHATALLRLGRSAEARPIAARVFATGYRRRPFVELCAKYGIAPG